MIHRDIQLEVSDFIISDMCVLYPCTLLETKQTDRFKLNLACMNLANISSPFSFFICHGTMHTEIQFSHKLYTPLKTSINFFNMYKLQSGIK